MYGANFKYTWYCKKEPVVKDNSSIISFTDGKGEEINVIPSYYQKVKLTRFLHERLYPDEYK